ncbi:MAG: LptF/LptG family permease [Phycisphaerales bacterium]|nr:LptF/LptG family permease [Phycisphaerales bacterium]
MPRRGLSITLWKYALAELWRLILLTSFVLVAVIAFAATVKPLADGKIGPLDALRFMGLAIIPMLQYALPFSAGFAATLAYHRLSQDNEVAAAYASGVSHRAILAPALISGLVLAVVLAGLNQVAIPRFLRSMQQMITQDLSKIVVASIERGQPVAIDANTQIYADHIERLDPRSNPSLRDAGVKEWLVLEGVAAVETSRAGTVKVEAIANRAQLLIMPPKDETGDAVAVLQFERGVLVDGTKMVSAEASKAIPMPIRNAFKDDPKFLSFTELARLRQHPEGMNWIEQKRRDTAFHIAERLTTERLRGALLRDGRAVLRGADDQDVVLRASGMELAERGRWALAGPLSETSQALPVQVELVRPRLESGPGGSMIMSGRRASLFTNMGPDAANRDLTLRIELDDASTRVVASDSRTEASSGGVLSHKVIGGLRLKENPVDDLLDGDKWPSARLLRELADPRLAGPSPDTFIRPPAEDLRKSINRLMREITSKQHERWAMSAACFVMIAAGALTAIRLGDSLPLTVYLWSFFPALATVITISSGQQLTHDKGPVGLLVLWGGVAAFALYAGAVYWKLRRR